LSRRLIWVLLAAAQLALLLPLAYRLPIQIDEAYTLQTTGSSLLHAIGAALHFELQPPLYFAGLDLWRHLNGSIFFARLFSVACAAGATYLTPGLVRRYLPEIDPLIATCAVAFNPFVVWVALDIRLYALVLLLTALILRTFYDGFLADQPARWARTAFTVAALCAVYTQYYAVFLLIALGASLLFTGRLSALKSYLIVIGVVFVATIPLLLVVPSQVVAFGSGNHASAFRVLGKALGAIHNFVFALHGPPARALWICAYAIAAAALVLGIRARTVRPTRWSSLIWMVAGIATSVFVVVLAVSGEPVQQRYVTMLFFPVILAAFSAAASLWAVRPNAAALALTCLALASYVFSMVGEYRGMEKAGDWDLTAAYVQANEVKGQPILVFAGNFALAFDQYYRGHNEVLPVPRRMNPDRYDFESLQVRSEGQIDSLIAGIRGRPASVWLITTGRCGKSSFQQGCGIVERFVSDQTHVVSDRRFGSTRVRLLQPDAAIRPRVTHN
jgi:hypothetical protein